MKKFYFFDAALTFALTSMKEQIEDTSFGFLWFLISPLGLFLVLFFVFRSFFEIENYFSYLGLGILLWTFMKQSLDESTVAIRANSLLIKSFSFPLEVFIFGIVLKNLFINIFSFFGFLIIALIFGTFSFNLFFYFFVLFIFSFFVFGLSMIFSTLGSLSGDFISFWGLLHVLWWFFTPFFYVIDSGWHYTLNLFNPAFHFLEFCRLISLQGDFFNIFLVLSILSSGIFLISGWLLFSHYKIIFTEKI